MNHTPAQRLAIAAAFRAAKPLLWDGVLPYGRDLRPANICSALVRSESQARHEASEVIMARIEGFGFFTGWLLAKGVPRDQLTPERVQAHRHAWLDRLIAEFEA